jgi:hypothetical protein
MIVYLLENPYEKADSEMPSKVFTDKSTANEYFSHITSNRVNYAFKPTIREIELVTDEFMELTLQQPKPPKEFT